MLYVKRPTKRHFTEAARLAAKEARRRKKEEKVERDLPEVFVVRKDGDQRAFRWEIRLFGGVILSRSPAEFATIASAQADGTAALARTMPRVMAQVLPQMAGPRLRGPAEARGSVRDPAVADAGEVGVVADLSALEGDLQAVEARDGARGAAHRRAG